MKGDFITIRQENSYPIDQFVIPGHYKDDVENVLIPYGLIQDRVEKIAHDISKTVTKPIVAICVLKGAYSFFSSLTDQLKKLINSNGQTIPMSIEFIKVKSYENTNSTGNVKISLTEEELKGFEGKELLIVEDIVDTGRTITELIKLLGKYSPSSIQVASLLLKRTEHSNNYMPDFVGFSIPDAFVIGYGLDYNEIFRDLNHICVISEAGKIKYRQ